MTTSKAKTPSAAKKKAGKPASKPQPFKAGMTPLEVLLAAMREAYESGGPAAAASLAKEAAPYVHPRVSSIEPAPAGGEAHKTYAVSDKPLSAEEWERQYGSGAGAGGGDE